MDAYSASTADWRGSLRKNSRRTVWVVATFFAIYIALGLLIDLYLYSSSYAGVPLSHIFLALITLKITPFATIITTLIAGVCLFVTFVFHNRMMLLGAEYHEVTPETARNPSERQLYNVVEEMKIAAGLSFMPKVFVIDADYMNAFASGFSEKSAMVAITKGLMEKLTRDELQAVMAHELSHIRHLDIRLTLMASVLANLLLMIIDIMFYGILFGRDRRNSEGAGWLALVIVIIRVLLPLITVLLMLFLSRTREYMADAGAVELMRNNEPLARALLKIQADHEQHAEAYAQEYKATRHESVRREAYIFDPVRAGIESRNSVSDMFSSHPSIKKRLAAIGIREKV